MSLANEPAIRIRVDPTNPGQFFACCGLLELADRLWHGVEGWFDDSHFCIKTLEGTATLCELMTAAHDIELANVGSTDDQDDDNDGENDSEDETATLIIVSPISLRLDWWKDKSLKPWAGSMSVRKIFLAMCSAIDPFNSDPFNYRKVVFDPVATTVTKKRGAKSKKRDPREPFYFDARRGANSLSLDIGFAPDPLKKILNLPTVAYPVIEAMSLVGLQRCRPKPTDTPRIFDYFAWRDPFPVSVLSVAVQGLIGNGNGYHFENAFRTTQRKHKAFNPATPLQRS